MRDGQWKGVQRALDYETSPYREAPGEVGEEGGGALVKEGFLEEGGQSRDWKEGRDRVKEKERKSSAGEHPVGGGRK